MKKGIYLAFLPGETVEEKFANAARLGFSCVEVPTLHDAASRRQHRAAAAAAGIMVPSVMNDGHWAHPLSDPDPAVRMQSRAIMLESLDTAAELGADTVLLVPAVVKPDVTSEQAWDRSVAEIELLLPAYRAAGVCIAVENVWNKFLLSHREMIAYIDFFASPSLQAYFDVGNIALMGYPQHWIRALGGRLRKVHIKGFDSRNRVFTPGLLAGDIDWAAVNSALREVGYDDVLTAEIAGIGETAWARSENISQDMDKILLM